MINNRYGKYSRFTNQSQDNIRTVENVHTEYEIPLPTDVENTNNQADRNKQQDNTFFSKLFKNIQIEELILLGLLFLFFMEGIEDEVLILLILYLLFWEKIFN